MQTPLVSATEKGEPSLRLRSTWKNGSKLTAAATFLACLLLLGCVPWLPLSTASTKSDPATDLALANSWAGQSSISQSPLSFLRSQSLAPHVPFSARRSPLPVPHSQVISRAVQSSETIAPSSGPSTDQSSLENIKASLLRVALLGGRGVYSRPAERDKAAALLGQLEQSQKGTPALHDGIWELVVSDVEPFRASVFFLALAEAVEARIMSNAADGALTVHSLATGGGEVGRVAHVVENNASRLHSLVELKTGSIPSIPLALTGTVISSGELTASQDGKDDMYSLSLKNTSVQGNKVRYGLPSQGGLQPGEEPNLLSWIGDQFAPSGDIFSSVLDPLGGGQTALLQLSYSDDDMMVWRTPRLGNHFFCFVRGDKESWPAMDELRSRQNTAQKSLIGSAAALGMLNAFFTRRAGIRPNERA